MIDCPAVTKSAIRTHYNLATPFYRLLWGPHIHHGLWQAKSRRRCPRAVDQGDGLSADGEAERAIV